MSLDLNAVQDLAESAPAEVALPTFAVLARFRSTARDGRAAVADVAGRLAPVRGLYEDVLVERQEDDDSFWVIARFVTVSVDVHSAVVAVHEEVSPLGADEVWAQAGR